MEGFCSMQRVIIPVRVSHSGNIHGGCARDTQLALGYEVFIAIISIISIFNMILPLVPGVDPDASQVVTTINIYLTLLFVFDFGLRLDRASSRRNYFFRDFGWADLLSIIPALRIFRLFRVYKSSQLIKRYSTRRFLGYLVETRAESARVR